VSSQEPPAHGARAPVEARRTIGGEAPAAPHLPRRTLAAALVALALVAVVAALSGGLPERLNGAGAGLSARSLLGDAAAVILALALAALCFALYDTLVSRERRRRPRVHWGIRLHRPHFSLDASALLVPLMIGAFVALILGLALLGGGPSRPAGHSAPTAPTSHIPGARALRGSGSLPVNGLVFVVVAVLVLLAGAVLALRARRARVGEPADAGIEALTAALDQSLEDLAAESDPRRAVIKAYDRMERALGASGTPRRAAETPLEYLRRALAAVHASQQSIRRLTDLFEQARFSRHTIEEAMKREAIDALSLLRSELDAGSPA
jgi:hypothetical protein